MISEGNYDSYPFCGGDRHRVQTQTETDTHRPHTQIQTQRRRQGHGHSRSEADARDICVIVKSKYKKNVCTPPPPPQLPRKTIESLLTENELNHDENLCWTSFSVVLIFKILCPASLVSHLGIGLSGRTGPGLRGQGDEDFSATLQVLLRNTMVWVMFRRNQYRFSQYLRFSRTRAW